MQHISEIESNYRALYGKLYAALFSLFGAKYSNQIEDAIQNSFYKSLKSWKPNKIPENKENWLFIVARNDLFNQIKQERKIVLHAPILSFEESGETPQEDLRLQTILFFASIENISSQIKIIFILKNIFGLHIKEISQCTLLSQEAIYKSINRAKKSITNKYQSEPFDINSTNIGYQEITIVEEILYAVFNIGFDSFDEKIETIVNDDLCLESLALTKVLFKEFRYTSSKNLIALFCFHLARIPAKLNDGKFIPFFNQETNKWNQHFIKLGFHYLEKPKDLNKYYIEALITSTHMTATKINNSHWNKIIQLYELLISITNSPIPKINLCYCLNKAQRTDEALKILERIESELPKEHFYFSLVKADILKKSNAKESSKIVDNMMINLSQTIRKQHISENITLNFHQQ